jgi:hypothetical protein
MKLGQQNISNFQVIRVIGMESIGMVCAYTLVCVFIRIRKQQRSGLVEQLISNIKKPLSFGPRPGATLHLKSVRCGHGEWDADLFYFNSLIGFRKSPI